MDDLVIPALRLGATDAGFAPQSLLRAAHVAAVEHRLRLRRGELPWLDLTARQVDAADALAPDVVGAELGDVWLEEFEVGLANELDLAPFADLYWSLRYARGDFDEGAVERELGAPLR